MSSPFRQLVIRVRGTSTPQRTRMFWLVWSCGLVLAIGLTVAAWSKPYLPGDIALAQFIQASRFPRGLADALDIVGTGLPATLIVVVVTLGFLIVHRRDLGIVFVAGSVLGLVSGPLKVLTDRARPAPPLVRVAQTLSDRSFPSGHVLHAVLSFGLFALLLEATSLSRAVRRVIQMGCIVVIGLMGVARIYVGAHWPSDVLGGYLWGAVILALIVRVGRSWHAREPEIRQHRRLCGRGRPGGALVIEPARSRVRRVSEPPR
jgi:membrane-associated phospholipid phosphatase